MDQELVHTSNEDIPISHFQITLIKCSWICGYRESIIEERICKLIIQIGIVDEKYEYMPGFQNTIGKSEITSTLSSHILIVSSFSQIRPLMWLQVIFQIQLLSFGIEYHSWYIKLKSCDDQTISRFQLHQLLLFSRLSFYHFPFLFVIRF